MDFCHGRPGRASRALVSQCGAPQRREGPLEQARPALVVGPQGGGFSPTMAWALQGAHSGCNRPDQPPGSGRHSRFAQAKHGVRPVIDGTNAEAERMRTEENQHRLIEDLLRFWLFGRPNFELR
jgi:hypothetical protein